MTAQGPTALGNQIVSNEVAIISMLQVIAQANPAMGQALALAMRENNSRIPSGLPGVHDWVEQYLEVIENRIVE